VGLVPVRKTTKGWLKEAYGLASPEGTGQFPDSHSPNVTPYRRKQAKEGGPAAKYLIRHQVHF